MESDVDGRCGLDAFAEGLIMCCIVKNRLVVESSWGRVGLKRIFVCREWAVEGVGRLLAFRWS